MTVIFLIYIHTFIVCQYKTCFLLIAAHPSSNYSKLNDEPLLILANRSGSFQMSDRELPTTSLDAAEVAVSLQGMAPFRGGKLCTVVCHRCLFENSVQPLPFLSSLTLHSGSARCWKLS